MTKRAELLESVFGTTTLDMSSGPSILSYEEAELVAQALPLQNIVKGLAAIAGSELATGLEAVGQRAADFSHDRTVALLVVKRLAKLMKKHPEAFADEFMSHLAMRG